MNHSTYPDQHILTEIYSTLEEAAGVGTWRYSFANGRLHWSAGIYRILGLEPWHEEPSHDLFGGRMHPADRIAIDNLADYLKEVRVIDRAFRVLRPHGRLRWVAHKAEVFCNSNDEPTFAAGILVDQTDLYEARQAQSFSEQRLRAISSITRSFTWTVRANGHKPPSQGWMTLTGQSASQSSKFGWLDAVHVDDRARVKNAWIAAADAKRSYAAKYRVICADGSIRWFISRCEPLFSEHGDLIEWFGVGIDISDVKEPSDPLNQPLQVERLSGSILRAGRALLDWSLEQFSTESGLSVSSIRRLEAQAILSLRSGSAATAVNCIRKHGVDIHCFDEGGPYVRLRPNR